MVSVVNLFLGEYLQRFCKINYSRAKLALFYLTVAEICKGYSRLKLLMRSIPAYTECPLKRLSRLIKTSELLVKERHIIICFCKLKIIRRKLLMEDCKYLCIPLRRLLILSRSPVNSCRIQERHGIRNRAGHSEFTTASSAALIALS